MNSSSGSGTPRPTPRPTPQPLPRPIALQLILAAYASGDASTLALCGINVDLGFDQDEGPRKKRKNSSKNRFDSSTTRRLQWEYYFSRRPLFRSVYRMELDCFQMFMQEVRAQSSLFERRFDAMGEGGIFPEIKILACLRVLVTGLSSVQIADIYKIGRSTLDKCFGQFVEMVPEVLKNWTKWPDDEEAKKICDEHEAQHGFKGMLGSLDCLHWHWGQCMMIDHYAYCGKSGKPTIVLEAICQKNLKFLYFNFGAPGVQNDVSILRSSPIVTKIAQGKWPKVEYEVGGVKRSKPYVLCDGIYPKWDVLVLAFARPINAAEKLFTRLQESARKDIERAFGIMRKRWNALRQACLKKDKDKIISMMNTMIGLHNFIIEYNEGKRRADFLVEEMDEDPAAYLADTQAWQEERSNEVLSRDLQQELRTDGEPDGPMERLLELFNADRHLELRQGLVTELANSL